LMWGDQFNWVFSRSGDGRLPSWAAPEATCAATLSKGKLATLGAGGAP
jgi:hypothetical protein